jgi:hypothetical protein
MRARPSRRRAIISAAVLVCLLVMAIVCGSLLRLTRTERGLNRAEERQLQADWLAESGLDRAAARLEKDPNYRGETWKISADDLGGPAPGVVTIEVEPGRGPDAARRRLVTVRADYPPEAPQRVRVTRAASHDLVPDRAGATP